MEERHYVQSYIKKIEFKNGGTLTKAKINLKSLSECAVDEKGFVKVVIAARKEPGQYGDTHYMYEDTWKPDPNYTPREQTAPVKKEEVVEDDTYINDLPF